MVLILEEKKKLTYNFSPLNLDNYSFQSLKKNHALITSSNFQKIIFSSSTMVFHSLEFIFNMISLN